MEPQLLQRVLEVLDTPSKIRPHPDLLDLNLPVNQRSPGLGRTERHTQKLGSSESLFLPARHLLSIWVTS